MPLGTAWHWQRKAQTDTLRPFRPRSCDAGVQDGEAASLPVAGEAQTTTALGHVPVTPREDVVAPTHGAKQFPGGETWILGTRCSFGITRFMDCGFSCINTVDFNATKQIEI